MERYGQELLVTSTNERYVIAGKNYPPRTSHHHFEHQTWKNAGLFLTMNVLEECAIPVAPGSHNFVFYSDGEKDKLCTVIKLEEMKLAKECVFFRHGSAQHAVCG